MGTVTELNDPFEYITDAVTEKLIGVSWCDRIYSMAIMSNGEVITNSLEVEIPKHELKQLMIMWLALEYPDSLNIDD